jgi:hypothetical protein
MGGLAHPTTRAKSIIIGATHNQVLDRDVVLLVAIMGYD